MTEELKNTIKEEILKLPKEAQQAINNFAWEKITEDIGKKYLLSESEITNFQAETAIILVGAENINFYPENIANIIKKPKEIIDKMAQESFEKIINPIRKNIEDGIKNNIAQREMNWQQSINFILSGGDYLSLINDDNSLNNTESQKTDNILGTKSMQDMKDRLVN